MNMVNNIYKIIIIFLIFSCSVLLMKDYYVLKNVYSENSRLQLAEEKLKKQVIGKEQINYTDILKELNEIEGIHVINLASNDKEKLTAQFEMTGNQTEIKNILEKIKKIRYFNSIDDIKIERDKIQDIKTKANVSFIKN